MKIFNDIKITEQLLKIIFDKLGINFSDVPYGVLATEVQVLLFFVFKQIFRYDEKFAELNISQIQRNMFHVILEHKLKDLNKLFNLTYSQFKNILKQRIKYYEEVYNSAEKKQLNLHEFKVQVMYSASYLFYILIADIENFKKTSFPFATLKEIHKQTIQKRNENYNKYGELDEFYIETVEFLEIIYNTSFDFVEEMYEQYINEKIKLEEEQKCMYTKEKENFDTIRFVVLIIFFMFLFLCLCVSFVQ